MVQVILAILVVLDPLVFHQRLEYHVHRDFQVSLLDLVVHLSLSNLEVLVIQAYQDHLVLPYYQMVLVDHDHQIGLKNDALENCKVIKNCVTFCSNWSV